MYIQFIYTFWNLHFPCPQIACEYEWGPIISNNLVFTSLFLRTSSSLPEPFPPKYFRSTLGSLHICSSSSLFWSFFLVLFVPTGESSTPTSGHSSSAGCFSMGYGNTWAVAAISQFPQNGPESSWDQSSTVICGRVVWGWGWSWNELAFSYFFCTLLKGSTLYFTVSKPHFYL